MSKKKRPKRKKRDLKAKYTLILIILLLILLLLLLIWRFNLAGKLFSFSNEPQLFVIEGECYVMMENLIFQISNDGDCRLHCNSECWARQLKFYESEFVETPNSCNLCNCYCI